MIDAKMGMISVVSPVYRGEGLVDELVERITKNLAPLTDKYEIILVEDRGPDRSWDRIREIASRDPHVKGIRFSKNFGQHYAISAGLDHAQGEWVIIMDCDLQDRPEEFAGLLAKAKEGYDVVLARRVQRTDGFFKRLFSSLFYRVLSWLTGVRHDPAIANFGVYHRRVVSAICSMRESIRYLPVMTRWVGFERATVDVEHGSRHEGKSSYSFRRLMDLGLNIILAYSDKPLRMMISVGLVISACALGFAGLTVFRKLQGYIIEPGYSSIIVSIWFFAGLIMLMLGILGLYIGKTFEGVRNRPIYLIDEEINLRK